MTSNALLFLLLAALATLNGRVEEADAKRSSRRKRRSSRSSSTGRPDAETGGAETGAA
jgi:hypothetical protein